MPLDPHRILVVEDDPIDRAMISASLSASGFDVTSTDSALSASQLIGELQPSAILLDIALPYRSGATWLADLTADERTADIPIVVVSAVSEVLPAERRALAPAVVARPSRPRALARLVGQACRLPRAQTGRPEVRPG